MKISSIVQNNIPKQIIIQWLRHHNILSRRVDESKFLNYKYYPDLPGNNTLCGSWGVIRKYLRGNLVFRPYYQSLMYYDKFIELGANRIEDFNYVELKDLYSMGLSLDEGMRLYKLLKRKCGLYLVLLVLFRC